MLGELKLEENVVLVVDWHWVDESFDHAFGREEAIGREVESIQLWVWIGGMDYDLTRGLSEREYLYFLELAREQASDLVESVTF